MYLFLVFVAYKCIAFPLENNWKKIYAETILIVKCTNIYYRKKIKSHRFIT